MSKSHKKIETLKILNGKLFKTIEDNHNLNKNNRNQFQPKTGFGDFMFKNEYS